MTLRKFNEFAPKRNIKEIGQTHINDLLSDRTLNVHTADKSNRLNTDSWFDQSI
jgi:hypothetical protein